jgi:hypothetical protein
MKHGHRFLIGTLMTAVLAVTLALLAAGGRGALAEGSIIYVDADSTGEDLDGTSWEKAFQYLPEVLEVAESGDQIWVAEGTYRPTVEHGGSGSRYRSFQMLNGVAIYGGFDPSTGDDTWQERDWRHNVTVLSGDIGILGDSSDNCYHVFYHPGGTDLNGNAILDGFTISGGNANGTAPHNLGGGMLNGGSMYRGSNPTLNNCIFESNRAVRGGGMYNELSQPTLTNSTFQNNVALAGGGGMHNTFYSAPALTNCYFLSNAAYNAGGGMWNDGSAPTLTDCTFRYNWSYGGGGIYNHLSAPTLTGCTINDNSADDNGGGMLNNESSPVLTDCNIRYNESGERGGGMYNGDSSPVLTGCFLVMNTARYGGGILNYESSPTLINSYLSINSAAVAGGGMYNTNGSSPALSGCTFWYNSAESDGGGMYNTNSSSPDLTGVSFLGNSATHDGGGMYNGNSSPLLGNCTFWGNQAEYGGGIFNYNSSSPVLTNCTFSGNSASAAGGAVANSQSAPTLTNCILWSNNPDQIFNSASSPAVTYSDVQGGYTGTGNIDEDPLFVDPGNRDFHLKWTSPCVDQGNNLAPNLPAYDVDGDPRIQDGDRDGLAFVDMGVDELGRRVYLPVVLSNY